MTVQLRPVAHDPIADLEAERSCLGACFLDAGAVHVLAASVGQDEYSSERHQVIAGALYVMAAAGEPIDILTVRSALEARGQLAKAGGIDYLSDLAGEVPTAANVGSYAAIVADRARRRRLREALRSAALEVDDLGSDLDEVEGAIDRARSASWRGRRRAMRKFDAIMGERFDAIATAAVAVDGVTGLRTGISAFDRLTGGLKPHQLVVLAAATSVGKTALGMQMAVAVAGEGVRVLVFSAEMGAGELGDRQIASTSGRAIREFQPDEAISTAVGQLADLPLWIDDRGALTVGQVRAQARWLHAQAPVGLVVVDYLQLFRADERGLPRHEALGQVSGGLKALAKELECPVLALSQLNRESVKEKRPPQLHDLRESGAIEQDADVVLLLWREAERVRRHDGREETKLRVAKHRGGRKGVITLLFDGPRFRFQEA